METKIKTEYVTSDGVRHEDAELAELHQEACDIVADNIDGFAPTLQSFTSDKGKTPEKVRAFLFDWQLYVTSHRPRPSRAVPDQDYATNSSGSHDIDTVTSSIIDRAKERLQNRPDVGNTVSEYKPA